MESFDPVADDARALAYLEAQLQRAREQRRERLEQLLEVVRADVVLEMQLAVAYESRIAGPRV